MIASQIQIYMLRRTISERNSFAEISGTSFSRYNLRWTLTLAKTIARLCVSSTKTLLPRKILMEKEAENLIKNLKFPWKEVLN